MDKPSINLVVIGHIDAGKSSAAGHLIYKLGGVDEETVKRHENAAIQQGKQTFKYAWILDKLSAERDRGVTIDTSSFRFETGKFVYTLIDAPGHRDFLKNMIKGTAQADVALLVVSAAKGGFEAGFSEYGQTREHAVLAYAMGVKQIICAVTKMDDSTVNYSEDRFKQICEETTNYLKRIGLTKVTFVPISGWTGENLTQSASTMPWWKGSTLVDALDSVTPPKRLVDLPLRFTVQKVHTIADCGTVAVGRVESGIVKVGQELVVAPVMATATVKSIQRNHKNVAGAEAGESVGLCITCDAETVQRGHVLGDVHENPPSCAVEFVAQMLVLNHPGEIRAGYTPILDCHTVHVPCRFAEITKKIDRKTGKATDNAPRSVKAMDSCVVRLVPTKPLCVETFKDFPPLGRFSIRDLRQTIAIGMIKQVRTKSQLDGEKEQEDESEAELSESK